MLTTRLALDQYSAVLPGMLARFNVPDLIRELGPRWLAELVSCQLSIVSSLVNI